MDKKEVLDFLRGSNYRSFKNSRIRLKEKLVEYKGGKCEICGYDKCITALDFHHLNPNEKDFSLGSGSAIAFEKAKKEVDKCILVCSNCHREIHHNQILEQYKEENDKMIDVYTEILNNREEYGNIPIKDSYKFLAYTSIKEDIENGMSREDIFKKYCINNRTFNKFLKENNISFNKRKIIGDKPTKDELIGLLKTTSKSQIGKMYGVSCSAVIKWCRKYGLM